jgi:BCD family chlorophyll transporter-like MFS transporter
MKFLGWDASIITIYFGIAILFELSRLVAGYLQDRQPRTRFFLIIGSILSIVGLGLIPVLITETNGPIFILSIALYYFGTAITTTVVDSYLTLISHPKERYRISGTLQFSRLLGFAFGGILGSILYSQLDFSVFITIITILFTIFAFTTIISLNFETWGVNPAQSKSHILPNPPSVSSVLRSLYDPNVILMSTFLVLFSVGLFMQDLIIEPFAISELDFEKSDVGKIVALWGIITLVFVPVGSTLEPKLGKLKTIFYGLIIAFMGMIIISIASNLQNTLYFYIGLVIFSTGGGVSSSPAISVMLDLCFINRSHTAFLLGFFGVIVTIGRAFAAILSGLILDYSDDRFTLVFVTESIFILLSLIPIIPISRKVDTWLGMGQFKDTMLHSIPSLD